MENNNLNVTDSQIAKHLAARAVMALRSGSPVQSLSLNRPGIAESGIVCDWKAQLASYSDDTRLVRRGFAFVYIGTIIDQKTTDMSNAQQAREAAVEWQLVQNVTETNPFGHVGYKLASRLLREDAALIDGLAIELSARQTFTQDDLRAWFETNAAALSLEELEQSSTF